MAYGVSHVLQGRKPPKTATLVAQDIVREISDKGLGAGVVLPPEREMLERYGVARGTLREALRFLEILGIISIKPGPRGGPVINAPHDRQLAGTLALLLQLANTHYSTILEARELLEPAMAAMAAERGTKKEIAEIGKSVERMHAEINDATFFLVENQRFHAMIAAAARNALFELLMGSLRWLTDATALGVEYPVAYRNVVVEAHRAIYQAIERRDVEGAREAMLLHMNDFRRYLSRHYSPVLTMPLRWDDVLG
jgi:DNA-binding FadR family transcriptional regulator